MLIVEFMQRGMDSGLKNLKKMLKRRNDLLRQLNPNVIEYLNKSKYYKKILRYNFAEKTFGLYQGALQSINSYLTRI